MIKKELFETNGEKIIYCQAENIEEAQKAGFPEGIHFCWEKDGKRIYSPGEIVKIINEGVGNNEKLDHKKLVASTKEIHEELLDKQKNMVLENLTRLKDQYVKSGYPDSVIKSLDANIEMHKNQSFNLSRDGTYKASFKEAEGILGKDLNKFYDKDFLEKHLGGKV